MPLQSSAGRAAGMWEGRGPARSFVSTLLKVLTNERGRGRVLALLTALENATIAMHMQAPCK